MTLSLPKHKIRVLLLEGVNDSAVRLFDANGYSEVERLTKALGPKELKQALSGVHMLGIRSRTQLTAEVMEAADRLLVVGCFSVGTNQVDLDAARKLGIPVFNAPYSNTRSVAELTIAEVAYLAALSNLAKVEAACGLAPDAVRRLGALGVLRFGGVAFGRGTCGVANGRSAISFEYGAESGAA